MGFPPLSVLELFTPNKATSLDFLLNFFSILSFVPFSRVSLPPFQWGHVSQNLGNWSFPPGVFFPPKWGSPHFPFWSYSPPKLVTSFHFFIKFFFIFFFFRFRGVPPPPLPVGSRFPKFGKL